MYERKKVVLASENPKPANAADITFPVVDSDGYTPVLICAGNRCVDLRTGEIIDIRTGEVVGHTEKIEITKVKHEKQ